MMPNSGDACSLPVTTECRYPLPPPSTVILTCSCDQSKWFCAD
jgi:hypothetical protein